MKQNAMSKIQLSLSCLIPVLMIGGSVAAETITFDDFPDGTVITTQYQTRGVVFDDAASRVKVVQAVPPGTASGTRALEIAVSDDVGWHPGPMKLRFTSLQRRVKVHVGLRFSWSDRYTVSVLRAFRATGELIQEVRASNTTGPAPITIPLEIDAAQNIIARAEVQLVRQTRVAGDQDTGVAETIDSLSFADDDPDLPVLDGIHVETPIVGGTSASGWVLRSFPSEVASGADGQIAALATKSPYMKIPRQVSFSGLSNTAEFSVETAPVAAPEVAVVLARLGDASVSVEVVLLPPNAVTSLRFDSTRILTGGPSGRGTVVIASPAPSHGAAVALSVNDPSLAKVPASVRIAPGSTEGWFDVQATAAEPGLLMVQASAGKTSQSASITVLPDEFIPRGYVNPDGKIDISDAVYLLSFLFLGGPAAPSTLHADVNSDRRVDLSDVIAILNMLFVGGFIRFPCPTIEATPDFVTDGQRVYLQGTGLANSRVVLKGFKYESYPNQFDYDGEGKEQIYCGCTRVRVESVPDPDGVDYDSFYFVVPMDAPSATYEIYILAPGPDCPRGGLGFTACSTDECSSMARIFVTPSFMVTRLDELEFIGNSEDDGDNPAELTFTFGGTSGGAFVEGADGTALSTFSGSYPGGDSGSSHLTNADNTSLYPHLPIFIGRESNMIRSECDEECEALPPGQRENCLESCAARDAQSRFDDILEIAVSGAEADSSSCTWCGTAAGLAAGAVGCYLSAKAGHAKEGCTLSFSLGQSLGSIVDSALEDDDDHLGIHAQSIYFDFASPFGWGSPGLQGPHKLGGPEKTNGNVDIFFENHRVGAPRILKHRVWLGALKVLDSYEDYDCGTPNEVFVNARAFLHDGQTELIAATRYPSGSSTWAMDQGIRYELGDSVMLANREYLPEFAPQSPLIYVEIAVWEKDSEKDLMGIHSRTHFLADLLSAPGYAVTGLSDEGLYVRRATRQVTVQVHGYNGSDRHCDDSIFASGWDPQAQNGRVEITYAIEVEALMYPQ